MCKKQKTWAAICMEICVIKDRIGRMLVRLTGGGSLASLWYGSVHPTVNNNSNFER